ncbi:MAG TPA: AAA family ATPase, partial [Polyangia bacterium]
MRLTGFGLADPVDGNGQARVDPAAAGALAFLAPEQIGRMDRPIDARTDLYALGVVLYRLATGATPFEVSDPNEWPHAHLARRPIDPCERRPDLPPVVGAILLKLLAKGMDDRYQTARGLAADFDRCLSQWLTVGELCSFALGTRDAIGRFVPRRLHGRERERRALREAFATVARTGAARWLFLVGDAGCGKSTLMQEARDEMDRARSGDATSILCGHRFATGKFEQDRGEVPHTAIVQALDGLFRQILTLPEGELEVWRKTLTEALAPNAALAVDWLPVLGHLLGRPEPPPTMPSQEAKHRFFAMVSRLFSALAQRMGPFLVFLDDLQWLDPGSAELLSVLSSQIVGQTLGPVLLVGAYRGGEVGPRHPLRQMIEHLRKAAGQKTEASGSSQPFVDEVALSPLASDELAGLLSELLTPAGGATETLARLLRERGGGNPFVALQWLGRWRDEGLLRFDDDAGEWRWDEDRIAADVARGDGLASTVESLLSLPAPTRTALATLAGFGASATMEPLAKVLAADARNRPGEAAIAIAQAEAALHPAVIAGLVARTRTGYAFAHDRIREAAYGLVPERDRPTLHLKIARALKTEDDVFARASHYNRALPWIADHADDDERRAVQRLNQEAGRKAKQASAFASARGYFAHA